MREDLPIITVIVTLFNRLDFIGQAIDSLVNQTLEKKYFEVIIVTNIDIDIGIYKEKLNIKLIRTTSKSVGKKYQLGLKSAVGQIICFLDDDDMFYSSKLKYVYDFFNNNPKICYYHNSMNYIDETRKKVIINFRKNDQQFARNNKYYYVSGKFSLGKLIHLKKIGGDFNMSSISIRKSVFTNGSAFLFSNSASPDIALLMEVILQKCGIYIDAIKLTGYRVRNYSKKIQVKVDEEEIPKTQLEMRKDLLRNAIESKEKMIIKYAYFEFYDFALYAGLINLRKETNVTRAMVKTYFKTLPIRFPFLWPYLIKYIIISIVLIIRPEEIKKINVDIAL